MKSVDSRWMREVMLKVAKCGKLIVGEGGLM
jgi:hypothetical protein